MENKLQNIGPINSGAMQIATTKSAQEVQAAVLMAKHYPRDQHAAIARIKESCKRVGLAEEAEYEFKRGGSKVCGASIRLAEVLAQCWGNIDCSIIELSQENGESQMMSRAWDLESNAISSKVFTVRHERDTKQGIKKLEANRDIYEMTANQGSRRLRANILAIIPGDVVDLARAECAKTLNGSNDEPIADRVAKMVDYAATFEIDKDQIEEYMGKKVDALSNIDLVRLRKIFTSIKDGMSEPKDWFAVKGKAADFGDVKAPTKDKSTPKPAAETKPKEQTEKPEEKATTSKATTTTPKASTPAGAKSKPAAEAAEATLPETPSTPALLKLLDDNLLTIDQLLAWAKKNNHPISDAKTMAEIVEKFDNLKDNIASF